MQKEQVKKILETIPDPEIPVINIVELGIVNDIIVSANKVVVKITPTYSGCPAMDQIEKDIISNLKAAGLQNAVVEKIYSPEYGISPPAKVSVHKKALLTGHEPDVVCPRCKSHNTLMVSQFGSTACKALYKCNDCHEPFDHFKCL
jgi:ring-1,2-phenylacetyl-CoA epoxidase subunit PaaD